MPSSSTAGWRRLLTIEDTFDLKGQLIAIPQPLLNEAIGGVYDAELRRPDGTVLSASLELTYTYPVPTPPVRSWTAAILAVAKPDVPMGTEVWVQPVPRHLAGTYDLLTRAYAGAIPDASVLPVLRVLYDHMSDRNLADVVCALMPARRVSWLNEVYSAAQLALDDPQVRAARDRLGEHGFDDWAREP